MKTLLAALVAAIALGVVAHASVPVAYDQMKCYRVKDPAPKASYTADFNGKAAQLGCTIKVPAKLVCNFVHKTNLTPPAPNFQFNGTQFNGQLFVCYRLKCPKFELDDTASDQFGDRAIVVKKSKMVCTPANVAPPV